MNWFTLVISSNGSAISSVCVAKLQDVEHDVEMQDCFLVIRNISEIIFELQEKIVHGNLELNGILEELEARKELCCRK